MYASIDVIYVKAQDFLNQRQRNMSVREFLTKLNSLAKYASSMANLERGKLDVFMGGLKVDIAKDLRPRGSAWLRTKSCQRSLYH